MKTTSDGKGFFCSPQKVLEKFYDTRRHFFCVIMSFDANRILKESSTLVGLRLLPKASQHPKLQDRETVIPILRQAGSDTKEAMEQLRPVYDEVELLRQTTFTDKDGKAITNIPGSSCQSHSHDGLSFPVPPLVVHTLDMKAMKVAMDLVDQDCVLCQNRTFAFATIIDKQSKMPVELQDVKNAFQENKDTFHLRYGPLKTPIGTHTGPKALNGVTPQTVALCTMHGEIRLFTNETKHFLKKVCSSLFQQFQCNTIH